MKISVINSVSQNRRVNFNNKKAKNNSYSSLPQAKDYVSFTGKNERQAAGAAAVLATLGLFSGCAGRTVDANVAPANIPNIPEADVNNISSAPVKDLDDYIPAAEAPTAPEEPTGPLAPLPFAPIFDTYEDIFGYGEMLEELIASITSDDMTDEQKTAVLLAEAEKEEGLLEQSRQELEEARADLEVAIEDYRSGKLTEDELVAKMVGIQGYERNVRQHSALSRGLKEAAEGISTVKSTVPTDVEPEPPRAPEKTGDPVVESSLPTEPVIPERPLPIAPIFDSHEDLFGYDKMIEELIASITTPDMTKEQRAQALYAEADRQDELLEQTLQKLETARADLEVAIEAYLNGDMTEEELVDKMIGIQFLERDERKHTALAKGLRESAVNGPSVAPTSPTTPVVGPEEPKEPVRLPVAPIFDTFEDINGYGMMLDELIASITNENMTNEQKASVLLAEAEKEEGLLEQSRQELEEARADLEAAIQEFYNGKMTEDELVSKMIGIQDYERNVRQHNALSKGLREAAEEYSMPAPTAPVEPERPLPVAPIFDTYEDIFGYGKMLGEVIDSIVSDDMTNEQKALALLAEADKEAELLEQSRQELAQARVDLQTAIEDYRSGKITEDELVAKMVGIQGYERNVRQHSALSRGLAHAAEKYFPVAPTGPVPPREPEPVDPIP